MFTYQHVYMFNTLVHNNTKCILVGIEQYFVLLQKNVVYLQYNSKVQRLWKIQIIIYRRWSMP